MALALDPAGLLAPLSDAEPCGPDLDAEGDLDFLNQVSQVEGLLPASFFTRDDEGRPLPFDRTSIDFRRENKALLGLLERSRDLRVLTLLARLATLDRDLKGFADTLAGIAGLLDARWEGVHPRGEGGAYELRGAVLQTLDDMASVVLPLQHLPLVQSRRHGAISFRTLMVADGEVSAREDEPALDRPTIVRTFEEADPDALRPLREALAATAEAVGRIRAITVARGGHDSAVSLDRLGVLVERIGKLVDEGAGAPAAPEPEAAPAPAPTGGGPAAGAAPAQGLASAAQAAAALSAVAAYLRANEPSSPAEVLTRQALALVGKPFVEVMRILIPAHAQEAVLTIGAGRSLRLSFEQLAAVSEEGVGDGGGGAPEGESENGDGDGGEAEAAPAAPPAAPRPATRAEALGLLREAGSYFRSREPTSPIPLLIDRALGLADRDFMAILRDVLPDLNSE